MRVLLSIDDRQDPLQAMSMLGYLVSRDAHAVTRFQSEREQLTLRLADLAGRQKRLTEMRRVCRPGGLIAARDGDYAGMFWFPDDPGLTEWQALYRNVARALGSEPDAGRRLLERLAQAWRRWTASEDGWFFIPHGEILCHV